jgi:hypothetical protein
MERAYIRLFDDDLRRIRAYALEELDRFLHYSGSPPGKFCVYRKRLIAICLCQGAAQHYLQSEQTAHFDRTVVVPRDKIKKKRYRIDLNGKVMAGVRDIDVWLFFRPHPRIGIPHRGNCRKHTLRSLGRLGERDLDFMKKVVSATTLAKSKTSRPADIVRSYLEHENTQSSNYLANASVIGLYPNSLFARLIWKVKWLSNKEHI